MTSWISLISGYATYPLMRQGNDEQKEKKEKDEEEEKDTNEGVKFGNKTTESEFGQL